MTVCRRERERDDGGVIWREVRKRWMGKCGTRTGKRQASSTSSRPFKWGFSICRQKLRLSLGHPMSCQLQMTLDAPEINATFEGKFREENMKLLRISHFCVIVHDSAIIFALRGHLLKFPASREQTRGSPPSAIQPFNMRFPTAQPARSAQVSSRLAATAPGAARSSSAAAVNQ